MTKKLVNFRIDSTLWEKYQSYCKSIGLTATEDLINRINSTLGDDKDCKDKCKDNNNNVKTDCKDKCKDNKEIESIKIELLKQQINVNNQINLLTKRLDKLEQENINLKKVNNQLINNVQLIKDSQDNLIEKLEKLEQDNVNQDLLLPESEAREMFPESGELPEVDPPVETINYSSLTIAQLKNKLDELGISYRKKATKPELLNHLSNYC